MLKDKVTIGPIPLTLRLGWFEPERQVPQTIVVRLEFLLDTRKAASTDDLVHTIDYGIALQIKQLTEPKVYKLLETVAEDIATYCLSIDPVKNVQVCVQKCLPFDKTILGGVEISRSR